MCSAALVHLLTRSLKNDQMLGYLAFLNHSERARKIQPKVMQWLLLLEMAVLHGRYFRSLENIEYIEYASTEGEKNGSKRLKD